MQIYIYYQLNLDPLAYLTAKPVYWHHIVVKQSTVFIGQAPSKENRQLMLKRPKLSMTFRQVFLKTLLGEGIIGEWSAHGPSSDSFLVR